MLQFPLTKSSTSRLTAHRILRIKKVCQYVVQKLELELPKRSEYQKFLEGAVVTGKSPSKLNLVQFFKSWKKKKEDTPNSTTTTTSSNEKPPGEDEVIKPEEYLEILCDDKVIHCFLVFILFQGIGSKL